jgi:UDP-N-acetyl-D-glucosamine dehydrogenase
LSLNWFEELRKHLLSKDLCVNVYGLGFVGLRLAAALVRNGIKAVGIDNDPDKVGRMLRLEFAELGEKDTHTLMKAVENNLLKIVASGDMLVSRQRASVICVPTPVDATGLPIMDAIVNVGNQIAGNIKEGDLVVVESTGHPGMTEEVLRPALERSGLKAGKDFALAVSPERIDPGSDTYDCPESIPKVVGGLDANSAKLAAILYERIIGPQVHIASSIRVAEMTKLLENVFRFINICFVNEFALICEQLGVDIWEVIHLTETKPFAFLSHYPGPGAGGPCLPKDSCLLSFVAKRVSAQTLFIDQSLSVNRSMPNHVVELLIRGLNDVSKSVKGSTVCVAGLAYKPKVNDIRGTAAIPIIRTILNLGAKAKVYDPLVRKISVDGSTIDSGPSLLESVDSCDAVVFLHGDANLRQYDLLSLRDRMRPRPIIVDTKGLFDPEHCRRAGFRYVGLGRPLSLDAGIAVIKETHK